MPGCPLRPLLRVRTRSDQDCCGDGPGGIGQCCHNGGQLCVQCLSGADGPCVPLTDYAYARGCCPIANSTAGMCSGHGTCYPDPNPSTVHCQCEPGFTGGDCSCNGLPCCEAAFTACGATCACYGALDNCLRLVEVTPKVLAANIMACTANGCTPAQCMPWNSSDSTKAASGAPGAPP